MRGSAPDIRHERREAVLLKADQIRRRQVVRNDDLFFFFDTLRRLARPTDLARAAHEFFDDALHHLDHVRFALPQIRVIKGIELFDQCIHLLHQGPLGITTAFANQRLRYINQLGILKNQGMDIDERAHFGRRFGHVVTQIVQFDTHPVDCLFKARHFLFQLPRRQREVRYLKRGMRQQLRLTDGNATGNAKAVKSKAHRAGSFSLLAFAEIIVDEAN